MSEPRKPSRRQFLSGVAAIDALGDVMHGVDTAGIELNVGSAGVYHLELSRRAMACDFEITLGSGQNAAAERALEALDLVDTLESQLSVFRDDSELSQINRLAATEALPVEPGLFQLLHLATELHRQTDGAFDITAGPLSKVWGFYRREGRIPDRHDLAEALACVGSQHLLLDDQDKSVQFLRPNIEINLGGIGKGYALDRCALLLGDVSGQGDNGVTSFLIHAGRSSVLARGSGGELPGWSVGIRHPLRPERRLGEMRLCNAALGTSGSGTQFFHHQGRRYGHILDPRTGSPADGVLSSTVVAPSAAVADALATAFYILGPEGAERYHQLDPTVGALIVTRGKRAGDIEFHSIGLPEQVWCPLPE